MIFAVKQKLSDQNYNNTKLQISLYKYSLLILWKQRNGNRNKYLLLCHLLTSYNRFIIRPRTHFPLSLQVNHDFITFFSITFFFCVSDFLLCLLSASYFLSKCFSLSTFSLVHVILAHCFATWTAITKQCKYASMHV